MTLAADVETDEEKPSKKSKLPLIIGVVLAILGGAGGFMTVKMGLLPFGAQPETKDIETASDTPSVVTEDVTFIALDPITISLPPDSGRQLLRLTAELDVAPENAAGVEALKPRILDILNTYLRAIEVEDLEAPTALFRLRTHMLHRVQVVAGQGVVRDVLITEFVLN